MRRINLLLQQPKRKKYRKLSRWATLYGQTYGPKLVASNFALEPWSLALGGYFTRHGQRSGATRATARLLRQLYQGLRGLRGTHRWVLQLAEGTTQSHQRPEFLYSHLRQRFPQKNLERQRRWIKRLRRRALIVDHRRRRRERLSLRRELLQQQRQQLLQQQQLPPSAPRRLKANPYRGTLSLSTVRQLPRLAMLRSKQLQLWWETPRPLLTAGRYLRLRQRYQVEIHRMGHARPLRSSKARPRRRAPSGFRRGNFRPPHRWSAALQHRRGSLNPRKGKATTSTPRRRRLDPTPEAVRRRKIRRLRRARIRSFRRCVLSVLRLLRRLNSLSSRLECQTHPTALLRSNLGYLLKLQHRCSRLRRRAAQSYGYRRYKANFFGQKTRQRLGRLLKISCSNEALQRRQRSIARTLARLERLANHRMTLLEKQMGWEMTGPTPEAGSRSPLLVLMWQQLQHRLLEIGRALLEVRQRLEGVFNPQMKRRQLRLLLKRAARRLLQRLRRRATASPAPATSRKTSKTSKVSTNPRTAAKPHRRNIPSRRPARGRRFLNPPARRSPKLWRRHRRVLRPGPAEPFDPQQWRKLVNRRWPTLQPQQLYGLNLYWEAPRSGQLGRWRRRSRSARQSHRPSRRLPSRRRSRPRKDRRSLYQPARRLLRRRLAFRPQVHYTVRELHLQDLALLEELEREGLEVRDFGQRYLLVTRRYGAVGYSTLLRDCFALLTPQLRLVSQVVGHKSARRTIYQVRFGVPLEQRVRALFGWLRDLVNKNEDYNLLRRNTARKPASKRVRDKPERSRRSTQPFHPRLTTELRRLMGADEPLLEQLALFDSRSSRVRVPRRHYRWEG